MAENNLMSSGIKTGNTSQLAKTIKVRDRKTQPSNLENYIDRNKKIAPKTLGLSTKEKEIVNHVVANKDTRKATPIRIPLAASARSTTSGSIVMTKSRYAINRKADDIIKANKSSVSNSVNRTSLNYPSIQKSVASEPMKSSKFNILQRKFNKPNETKKATSPEKPLNKHKANSTIKQDNKQENKHQ